MKTTVLVIFVTLMITSCSIDDSSITLVCKGTQKIETKNKVTNTFFPTESNQVTRTYKFYKKEVEVENSDTIKKKKVWIFNTDSQPEIFETNRKTTVPLNGSKIDVKEFSFVFVRKDDISVNRDYSKITDGKNQVSTSFILFVDRVTGLFTETTIDESLKQISKESIEGSCSKVEKNKI